MFNDADSNDKGWHNKFFLVRDKCKVFVCWWSIQDGPQPEDRDPPTNLSKKDNDYLLVFHDALDGLELIEDLFEDKLEPKPSNILSALLLCFNYISIILFLIYFHCFLSG